MSKNSNKSKIINNVITNKIIKHSHFKQSRFYRSHKLFVTLSSVAIASKWDEPEKIKVFIVSTVGTINTLIFSGLSHFDAIATDESVTKSLWLR